MPIDEASPDDLPEKQVIGLSSPVTYYETFI
jgi:hypothetical protein